MSLGLDATNLKCVMDAFQKWILKKMEKWPRDTQNTTLNNTIQSKQHAMKKPHSYSNRNKIYKGLFFVVEGFRAENVQNLQFLLIQ